MSKKAQFFAPDWPKFWILGEFFYKIIKNQAFLEQNLLIWAEFLYR